MKAYPLLNLQWIYPIVLSGIAGIAGGVSIVNNNHVTGNEMRVYRLAVAATGEFTAYHGNKAQALAAIKAIVADVNVIYEKELAIRFDLVSDASELAIIYDNSTTDPYSGDRLAMLDQNQSTLDTEVGEANYDIGHLFNRVSSGGGGGLASLGVVGESKSKGRGVSETMDPDAGDANFLEILLHEIGHQFGAQHTFNATAQGSCVDHPTNPTQNPRVESNAYEPASGSTLMSYAGFCGIDNLQAHANLYFHAVSFEQINEYIENNNHAAPNQQLFTGNHIPTVDGGIDYVIPANTPFELTAAGTDPDGDDLTFTWEQLDKGGPMGLPLSDNGFSPLFRSFPPSSLSTRTFPRLSDLLANTLDPPGETLPTKNRILNFRVTARDNNPAGGGVSSNDVLLTIVDTGRAFAVKSPNGGETWIGGASQLITWDVAGTTANGIDITQVDILLSVDGGLTFPHLLATTANDGSESIILPNLDTPLARLKVRGNGNIFFDLSNANFTISTDPASPGLSVTSTRTSEDGFVGTYDIALHTAPAGPVTILASSDSQSEVSTDGVSYSTTASLTFSSTSGTKIFVRAINDSLLEGAHTTDIVHRISASDSESYPMGAVLQKAIHQIEDNNARPVVGIDFDYVVEGQSPSNWTGLVLKDGMAVETLTGLVRDDGSPTSIEFEFRFLSTFNILRAALGESSATIPNHVPSLAKIGGFNSTNASVRATWRGLKPGRRYHIYVIGLDGDSANDLGQVVTITGATTLPTFTQSLPEGLLAINESTGSNASSLQSAAKTVAADSIGTIKVELVPLGDRIGIAGMAIGTADVIQASIVATDPSATEPSDNAQFEVSLQPGEVAPTGGLAIDYAINGTATNGADYASLMGTAVIPQGTERTIIAVNTINDSKQELPESVFITLTQTFDPLFVVASEPNQTATAIISSDEQNGFQTWSTSTFALADLLDPMKEATLWGGLADPDGDCLTNLAEYFHGTLPLTINDDPTSSTTTTSGGIDYLELIFPRRKSLSGVTYVIQEAALPASDTWEPALGIHEIISDIDGSAETVRAQYPMGSKTRRFLRLQLQEN